jgi:hypothetical protein
MKRRGYIAYHGETCDDCPVIPRLGLTAPLESEEEGNNSTERENGAEPIERPPLLPLGHALVQLGLDWGIGRKPDGDGGDRNGTKGKVDVKAPTPGDVVRKGATKEGADDTCKGEDAAKATKENWTVFEAGYLADDSENGDEDARGADTLNGTAKDEDIDIRTDTTYETAEFKDSDCDEIEVFGICDGEELTKGEHQAGLCD